MAHRLAVAAALLGLLACSWHVASAQRTVPQPAAECTEQRIDKRFYLEVGDFTCSYYRPGNATERGPTAITSGPRMPAACILVNNSYPAPVLRVTLGDWVQVDVKSSLTGRDISLHWHGLQQRETPWADGASYINSCPVKGGMSATYVFHVTEAGTYFYHGHAGMEWELGLFGALIVDDPNDPYTNLYDKELPTIMHLHDSWITPEAQSAQATLFGTYLRFAPTGIPLINGYYGDGSAMLPYPVLNLDSNTCYRTKFICSSSQWPGYFVSIHDQNGTAVNMTMLSLTAENLRPLNTHRFAFYIAQRAEAVFCTGAPGTWTMKLNSSQPYGGYCPPGVNPPNCIIGTNLEIRITDPATPTPKTANRTRLASFPFAETFDSIRNPELVVNYERVNVPPTPSQTWDIWVGTMAPKGTPPNLAGNMYAWTERGWGFAKPSAPPLFTNGGRCGTAPPPRPGQKPNETNDTAYLSKTVRFGEVVDMIFHNLSPFAHMMHLHGHDMIVLGSRYYIDSGLFLPGAVPPRFRGPQDLCPTNYMWAVPAYDNATGPPWPTAPPPGQTFPFSSFAFGCPRNASANNSAYYLSRPYVTDIVPVPANGWAHVRVRFDNPGVWYLHCHRNLHMHRGMGFLINSALDRVPKIPSWVDTSCGGTCQPVNQVCGPYSPNASDVVRCTNPRGPNVTNVCPPRGLSDMSNLYGQQAY